MSLATTIATQLSAIPPQVATIILAMLPIVELRGALPVAIALYKLPVWQAMLWSIIGNMLPVYLLLIFFEKASIFASAHSPLAKKILEKLYERTHGKLHSQIEKYGPLALLFFVAVPLPVTGAWTGALAAFVFNLPRKKAFFAILGGVCVASVIVTLLTLGATSAVNAIL